MIITPAIILFLASVRLAVAITWLLRASGIRLVGCRKREAHRRRTSLLVYMCITDVCMSCMYGYQFHIIWLLWAPSILLYLLYIHTTLMYCICIKVFLLLFIRQLFCRHLLRAESGQPGGGKVSRHYWCASLCHCLSGFPLRLCWPLHDTHIHEMPQTS